MNELSLFAGAGGGILGGYLLGWRTVCAVERDAYAAQVLAQRQNDGILRPFPIWSDVCSFDGKPWRGIVDVVSGGFPCRDISGAGKGAGIDGSRSGLWRQMARIIGEVRPRFVFVENSPLLVGRGLAMVISDLAKMGFDSNGVVYQHQTLERPINVTVSGLQPTPRASMGSHGIAWCRARAGEHRHNLEDWLAWKHLQDGGEETRPEHLPKLRRVADDVAFGVDRIKALGNGQVPRVAAAAFSLLKPD